MKQVNLIQGTQEWKAHRATHFNASDAPAMMGKSKYVTRNQLLHQIATDEEVEVSEATQRLFDRGHAAEAAIRPHIESIIGEELFPVTGVSDEYDDLSASFDGLTLLEDINFEHKLWNDALAEQVRNNDLEEHYLIQMDQQMLVSGAGKTIFVVSDGTPDKMEYCWVEPNKERQKAIIAGWEQFKKDLDNYQPKDIEVKPQGIAPDMLPSIHIELTGMVTASNLDEVRERSIQVFRSINRDLQTDDDFANAEKTVKWCSDIEGRLEKAKENALSQTATISELFNTIDQIKGEARETRLALDKQIKAQKENRKREVVRERQEALRQHVESIQKTIIVTMPPINADFTGSIKGKRSFAMMEDALDTELAAAKIEADRVADHLRGSLAIVKEGSAGYEFLFSDLELIAHKEHEDLKNLIKLRISEHKQAEAIRAEEAKKSDAAAKEAATVCPAEEQQASKPASPPETIKSVLTGKTRPTDAEIIDVISLHYRVHESKVIEWLLSMDLNAESEKLAVNI